MATKAGQLLEHEKHLLNNYEEKLKAIKAGNYEYDGSMPNDCVNAMYEKKVKIHKEAVAYLEGIDPEEEIIGNYGYGEEYVKYISIVNQ